MIIDFHTHTFLSDGELVPAELVRRAADKGYRAIGISDHVDTATLELIAPVIIKAARELSCVLDITVIAGIELTHVPPDLFSRAVFRARALGVEIVIAHGETIVEPVMSGTNRAALEAGVDILAHPGLITRKEVMLAREKGVLLELSGRKGHSLTNGHVFSSARETGAALIISSDAHAPEDLLTPLLYRQIVLGAGGSQKDCDHIKKTGEQIVQKVLSKRKKDT